MKMRIAIIITVILLMLGLCIGCADKGVKNEDGASTPTQSTGGEEQYKMVVDEVDKEITQSAANEFVVLKSKEADNLFPVTEKNFIGANRSIFELFETESIPARLAVSKGNTLIALRIDYLADAMDEHTFYYRVNEGNEIVALDTLNNGSGEHIRFYWHEGKVTAIRWFADAEESESDEIKYFVAPNLFPEQEQISEVAGYNWEYFQKNGADLK